MNSTMLADRRTGLVTIEVSERHRQLSTQLAEALCGRHTASCTPLNRADHFGELSRLECCHEAEPIRLAAGKRASRQSRELRSYLNKAGCQGELCLKMSLLEFSERVRRTSTAERVRRRAVSTPKRRVPGRAGGAGGAGGTRQAHHAASCAGALRRSQGDRRDHAAAPAELTESRRRSAPAG